MKQKYGKDIQVWINGGVIGTFHKKELHIAILHAHEYRLTSMKQRLQEREKEVAKLKKAILTEESLLTAMRKDGKTKKKK